jgi:hypothetical protein
MARTRSLGDRVLVVDPSLNRRLPATVSALTGVDSTGAPAATACTVNVFDPRSNPNRAVAGVTQNTDGTTAGTWDFAAESGLKLSSGTAVAGASGTINAPSGKFILASGGSAYTLTNSFISATSIVDVTVETAGTTAIVRTVVPASGSCVVTLSGAVGADTTISFNVVNGN